MGNGQWIEAGNGVFQRRYDPLDVSIGLVLGPSGAVVIDTRNNPAEALAVIEDVAEGFSLPIMAAINTHAHYDHSFGNQVFKAEGIPIYGHHLIARHYANYEKPHLDKVKNHPGTEPDKSWQEVVLTPPTVPVQAPTTICPGGREIELLPLAPGHTDTDLAVRIPDAGIWFLGDIIEESGPPMFGSGAHPLGWPQVLESLLERIGESDAIIPGHGTPVDRAFVVRQQQQLELLADELSAAHAQEIPAGKIRFSAGLLQIWPAQFLREAVQDVYAQLGD
ncbi:MBL fold metallo-hydrolase [Glutamicibacter halophytocola]|uniref:MBL fold metallo-hydrolase n=1 Tax=Glutamicibacter halophytocola TaxID=1933880 RepID=A0AA95BP45_9MICC|nr:MBL fold metallo-hydrolase [Glutamicibacter halophytocola]UUX57881.1 MBL fold metallo-hydrolase [Glutamicibacter halophytocola]